MKLKELLAKKSIKGEIGIEIETEGKNIVMAVNGTNSKFWKTERDGSLRGNFPEGAAEFVLAQPLEVKDVEEAVDELIELQKDATFDFSHRTSVHIHMNVLDYTIEDLGALFSVYYMCEDVLLNFCGDSRKGNHFCLRYRDADGIAVGLKALGENFARGLNSLSNDHFKYAALNLAPMTSYGSVEFRGMRGTMDKKVLMTWIGALVAMRDFAKKMGTAKKVYEYPFTVPADQMFDEIFGEHAEALKYPGYLDDLTMSRSLSLDIPFFFN